MSAVRIPDNPAPPKTVAWIAWEVLAGRRPSTGGPGHYFAFSVPVEREDVEAEVREEFKILTGEYHTLSCVGRCCADGAVGFLNYYAATVGYELQCPDDGKGKRRDGFVKMVRL